MIRIGNCSGFYGDRLSAMREMLNGGDLDFITGDYLAELTMLILGRDQMKDPSLGYARTFVRQAEDCLGIALEKGVRIVANAGGLNPAGLAEQAARGRRRPRAVPADRAPRGRRSGRPGGGARPAGQAAHRERVPRWLRHRHRAAARRRRGRHRPGHRCVARRRALHGRARVEPDVVRRAGGRRGRGPCHRVRHAGHGRQLQRFHVVARAARLPDRGGARRRVERDHQAPRHRRRGVVGHRDRAAGLRDPGHDVPRSRRLHPPRDHRARRRRSRPGADLGGEGVGAAGDAEGVRERARWLPQPGRARARRPRRRGEGRVGARAGRGRARRGPARGRRVVAGSAPTARTPTPRRPRRAGCGCPCATRTRTASGRRSPRRSSSWRSRPTRASRSPLRLLPRRRTASTERLTCRATQSTSAWS